MTNQLAHKDFFNTPAVKQKFQEVLNGNERQFTASLLSTTYWQEQVTLRL